MVDSLAEDPAGRRSSPPPGGTAVSDRSCRPARGLLHLNTPRGDIAMPYFTRSQDRLERGGKMVADIFCALLLLAFSLVCFGALGGVVAFVILEACLLAVDYLVPSTDDAPGNA